MHLKICQNLWIALLSQSNPFSLESKTASQKYGKLSIISNFKVPCVTLIIIQIVQIVYHNNFFVKVDLLLVSGFPLKCWLARACPGSSLHLTPSSLTALPRQLSSNQGSLSIKHDFYAIILLNSTCKHISCFIQNHFKFRYIIFNFF